MSMHTIARMLRFPVDNPYEAAIPAIELIDERWDMEIPTTSTESDIHLYHSDDDYNSDLDCLQEIYDVTIHNE